MKKFEDLKMEERNEIVLVFSNWLRRYSNDVVIRVLEKKETILNDAVAMKFLRELKEREEKEEKDFAHSVGSLMMNFETFKEFDVHNHPLTHADSYRDVLYDMYIK